MAYSRRLRSPTASLQSSARARRSTAACVRIEIRIAVQGSDYTEVQGSGFLIGRRRVLTSGHSLSQGAPHSIRVTPTKWRIIQSSQQLSICNLEFFLHVFSQPMGIADSPNSGQPLPISSILEDRGTFKCRLQTEDGHMFQTLRLKTEPSHSIVLQILSTN